LSTLPGLLLAWLMFAALLLTALPGLLLLLARLLLSAAAAVVDLFRLGRPGQVDSDLS
jgi:hypothetical protein